MINYKVPPLQWTNHCTKLEENLQEYYLMFILNTQKLYSKFTSLDLQKSNLMQTTAQ